MRCKTFCELGHQALETSINAWLQKNPVSPESIIVKYEVVAFEGEPKGYHFALLFYVPMQRVV